MKRLHALSALAILAIAVLAFVQNRPAAPAQAAQPQRDTSILKLPADAPQRAYLQISAVGEDIIPALEPLHGRVAYDDDRTARISAPIAGRVVGIRVQLGDSVQAGQTLAVLDSPEFAQARADRRKALADLQLKSKAFARAKLLYAGGVIAAKDYEAAEDDLTQTRAEAERSAARFKNLGGDRARDFELHSPIAGIVTERHINTGSEIAVDNTAPLFVVTDPKHLWIDLDIAEQDFEKINLGQNFRVQSDAYPNVTFEASAVFIGKVMDTQTRRATVHCVLHDDSERLKPEMFVRATPLGGNILRPRVPNTALIGEGLKTFLFVERNSGEIQKREVALAYRGHDDSYIESGLRTGERVVTSGALLLNAEMQGD